MELQQLRYVRAIADTGSFSRAAESCRVAQPSLSQQVLKLEQELGARLFDRLGRQVRLTDAGSAFVAHARSILNQVESARASVTGEDRELRGSVAAGAIPTVAPYLLPRITAEFAKRHRHARLRVVEATTPVLIAGLRDFSIDLAILALPLRYRDIETIPLRTEPLFAVLPKRHRFAGRPSLRLRELREEPFVLLRDGHCFRDLSLRACARARVRPRIAFESDQFSSVLGMVAAGIGVSLIPEMAIESGAGCRYVRLGDADAVRTIAAAVLRGRGLNRAQLAFLAGVRA